MLAGRTGYAKEVINRDNSHERKRGLIFMPKYISNEVLEAAYQEFLHGVTADKLCEKYGFSISTFRVWREQNGLLSKPHGGPHFKSDDIYHAVKQDIDNGMRQYEACKKHGITRPSYHSWLKRNDLWKLSKHDNKHRSISDDVYESILTDVRNGKKIKHACWDHRVSVQAFLCWRKRNGVKLP